MAIEFELLDAVDQHREHAHDTIPGQPRGVALIGFKPPQYHRDDDAHQQQDGNRNRPLWSQSQNR